MYDQEVDTLNQAHEEQREEEKQNSEQKRNEVQVRCYVQSEATTTMRLPGTFLSARLDRRIQQRAVAIATGLHHRCRRSSFGVESGGQQYKRLLQPLQSSDVKHWRGRSLA